MISKGLDTYLAGESMASHLFFGADETKIMTD